MRAVTCKKAWIRSYISHVAGMIAMAAVIQVLLLISTEEQPRAIIKETLSTNVS